MSKEPTATVSVTVTPEEHLTIRTAAHAANLAVSAWGVARLNASLRTPALRAQVFAAIQQLEANPMPRGSRKDRVSVVLKLPEHDHVKTVASGLRRTVHGVVQAALIEAAAAEVENLPGPVVRLVEQAHRKSGPGVSVAVPKGFKADPARVADLVRQMARGTRPALLDGHGRKIAEGVAKSAGKLASGKVEKLALTLTPAEVEELGHMAWVLDQPLAAVLSAFAIKAASAL